MTKSEMENLAQRQLDAYNARRLDDFCACFHPEVTVTLLLAGQTTCNGMDQFRANYKAMFESSPNLHCELKRRIVLDGAVLDEEHVTGSSRNPGAAVHAVAVYGFRDGLIDRVWFPR